MGYVIEIEANSHPSINGWYDPVKMMVDGDIVFSGIGSTCPNSVRPSSGKSWNDSYGWIASGIYNVETCIHPKYGRCVIVNGGGAVPSRNDNVNHDGAKILTEVFIHEGNRGSSNTLWRGSAGCPTIPPQYWKQFQEALPSGRGILIIKDSDMGKVC